MGCEVSKYHLKVANLAERYGLGRNPLHRIPVNFDGVGHELYIRRGSAGDLGVFHQVFTAKEYCLRYFPRSKALNALFESILRAGKTPLIVDAGANIGASVVWFSFTFPGSQVVAIEPEKGNCELLRKNCEGLRYKLIEGGIGSREETLFLQDPGISDWGFRLSQEGKYAVPVVAADQLIAAAPQDQVPFIFKIDIEGGESNLFSERTTWIEQIPLLIIELHDWLFPGQSNSGNFLRALSNLHFDFLFRNENVFCFNNKILGSFDTSHLAASALTNLHGTYL